MELEKQRQLDPAALEQVVPADVSLEERILMAARCQDLKKLPASSPSWPSACCLMDGGLIELCKGYHEPQEELVFHKVMKRLPPNATMIELGGYWAFYSLWFCSLGKGRRCMARRRLKPGAVRLAIKYGVQKLGVCVPGRIRCLV
jgi:hypothetical protein